MDEILLRATLQRSSRPPYSTNMSRSIQVAELMDTSGVKFGTSGARGLVNAMTDEVCFAYTTAFLQALRHRGDLSGSTPIAIGGDRRASTPRIMATVAHAARSAGHPALFCGLLPSPALALYGIDHGIPSIMITGSHIPEDRNGIKFNKATGEITKADEDAIRAQAIELPDIFDEGGNLRAEVALPDITDDAVALYRARFIQSLTSDLLTGLRVGVYGHSAVGRELLAEILVELGAEVTQLGFSDRFISVDTEAIRPEDVTLAREWAATGRFDALVSTDGDSDRPLVSDERGQWLRGDINGLICSRWLGARTVVTPVSSNTAIERSGAFTRVVRTRIGSPFVIAGMTQALERGDEAVVGFEANGGFLQASPLRRGDAFFRPLPTRDAFIVIIAVLASAKERDVPVSALRAELPQQFTASDRLKDFPSELGGNRVSELAKAGPAEMHRTFPELDAVANVDTTDGLRMTLASGEVLHLRPSGNAPELRCYAEASSEERAEQLVRYALRVLETWR